MVYLWSMPFFRFVFFNPKSIQDSDSWFSKSLVRSNAITPCFTADSYRVICSFKSAWSSFTIKIKDEKFKINQVQAHLFWVMFWEWFDSGAENSEDKPVRLCSCFHSVPWLIEPVVVWFASESSPALNLKKIEPQQRRKVSWNWAKLEIKHTCIRVAHLVFFDFYIKDKRGCGLHSPLHSLVCSSLAHCCWFSSRRWVRVLTTLALSSCSSSLWRSSCFTCSRKRWPTSIWKQQQQQEELTTSAGDIDYTNIWTFVLFQKHVLWIVYWNIN